MKRIFLDGALIVTLDKDRRMIEDGGLLIEGDTIVAVGKSRDLRVESEWTQVVDARDKVILPGFIDTHIHLSEHIIRSLIPDDDKEWMPKWLLPIYASLTPEDEYYSSMLAFIEMIRTGTTTFCEAGTCLHIDAVVQALRDSGMRGIVGRWTWDLPQEPERMRQSTDHALKANEEMIRYVSRQGEDRIRAWPLLLGMGTASDELVIGAKRLADENGVGLGFMHASNIPSLETESRVIPLRHFEELGVLDRNVKLTHMVYIDDDEIELLKNHGVKVSHCPTAAMKHSKGISKYGKFPEMISSGICVSLGVDSANSSDHSNMLRLVHFVAHMYKDFRMNQAVIPAETAIEMATVRGAEALLMDEQIGSIEKGKKADLVVFRRNHPEWRPLINVANNVAYAVTDRSIDSVYISGRLIMEKGAVIGFDEQKIYLKVEELSRRLLNRSKVSAKLKWPMV